MRQLPNTQHGLLQVSSADRQCEIIELLGRNSGALLK
jgi:hypothetical protein